MKTYNINQLKSDLHWKNDFQKHSSDANGFYLTATFGDTETLYVLVDNDNNEVERWTE